MSTITPTPEEMARRIARFSQLDRIVMQREARFSQEALDVIYARRLHPVVGLPDTDTPINDSAPIRGAGGMTITYAVCPPGQGPSLHSHNRTYETFTVCRGRFEFLWGDNAEHSVILEEFDVLSVPPRVCRSFRNVGALEGVLQVIITGGVHDKTDIAFPTSTAAKIAQVDPKLYEHLRASGHALPEVPPRAK